jgi:hypothetical protein
MEDWTVKMHNVAERTEHETVSMHVITIFTLIFLPGTFVSVRYGLPFLKDSVSTALTSCQTIFSSGILAFDDDNGDAYGAQMGDWQIRWSALKLFFAVCVPLMVVTILSWLGAYCHARHSRKKRQLSVEAQVDVKSENDPV